MGHQQPGTSSAGTQSTSMGAHSAPESSAGTHVAVGSSECNDMHYSLILNAIFFRKTIDQRPILKTYSKAKWFK